MMFIVPKGAMKFAKQEKQSMVLPTYKAYEHNNG